MSQHPMRPAALDATFEEFVRRATPRLFRSAFLLTGDRGHAEDLVQMTFWRVLGRWHEISGSADAYALKVLVNLSHDRRRHLSRRVFESESLSAREHAAADELHALVERDAVIQAAGGLPRRLRAVLVLRFFLDLSVADTAATLGTSEGAVKAYTARALERMRVLLSDEPISRGREPTQEVSDVD
jgi:RNA polymerase sigma-70 factor (sigma-E family)